MSIMSGALWPPRRFIENNIVAEDDTAAYCPVCGEHGADEGPLFLECPGIQSGSHPIIPKTDRYCREYCSNNTEENRCWYWRGIMPSEWTEVPPPTHQVVTQLGDRLYVVGNTILVFTDGPGGKNTSDPRLLRCGWAWVIAGPHGPISGVSGNMTGPQTVPRAELKALIEFTLELEQAPHITNVTLYSDCKMVVDLFNAGRERCMMSNFWEMWRDFWGPFDRIHHRMESFTILKVKSHSDTVPTHLKHGNDMADKYAGEAVREITS